MTVSTEIHTSGPYQGDGSTKQFGVEFSFLDETHLKVILTSAQGEAELTLQQDYKVTQNKDKKGFVSLAQPLPLGSKLTITRSVPFTQNAQYVQGDAFPAASHEQALDKLTMLAQQLKANAGRTIKSPHGEKVDLQLPSFANRSNKLLGFDDESVPQAITIGKGLNLANDLLTIKDGIGILSNEEGIHIFYGQGLDVFDGAIVVSPGNGLVFDEQARLEIEKELVQIIKETQGELIDLEGFVNFLAKRVSNLEIGTGGGEVTIHIGNGLQFDQKGNLTIKPHTGISVTSEGVSVRIGNGLEIDPSGNIKISDALQAEIAKKADESNIPKPEDWAGEGLEAKNDKLSVVEPEKRFSIIYPNGGMEMAPASVAANSRYVETNPFLNQNGGIFCVAEVFHNGKWGEGQLKSWTTSGGAAIGVGTSAYFFDGAIVVQTGTNQALASSAKQGNAFGIGDAPVYFPIPCRVKVWRVD